MKHIDDYYKDWSGVHHTVNSCHPVHDSAECTDFAQFYHSEMMEEANRQSIQIEAEESKYILCVFENLEARDGSLNYIERKICEKIKNFIKETENENYPNY